MSSNKWKLSTKMQVCIFLLSLIGNTVWAERGTFKTPLTWATPEAYTVRFADTPVTSVNEGDEGGEAPTISANKWLRKNGWEQVWPIPLIGKGKPLNFAGPSQNRFLRITADKSFFIWGSEVNLDPQELPILELVWGIEVFPDGAAMDRYKRHDRPIVIQVLLGDKLSTFGRPNLPRMLAFFWGETETIGDTYTCIPPVDVHTDERMMCIYPHIKYIALRNGSEGGVFTDRVNLLDHFHEQFPEYWNEHQQVPTIVGLSFETHSKHTKSLSSARLYSIRLLSGTDVDDPPWSHSDSVYPIDRVEED